MSLAEGCQRGGEKAFMDVNSNNSISFKHCGIKPTPFVALFFIFFSVSEVLVWRRTLSS